MRSTKRPLILRTYCRTRNWTATLCWKTIKARVLPIQCPQRKENDGIQPPIAGIPAAIAVTLVKSCLCMGHHGMPIALCMDRWFLDMKNYRATKPEGDEKVLPMCRLYGFSSIRHRGNTYSYRWEIHCRSRCPKYLGYDLDETKQPVFSFSAGKHTLNLLHAVDPGANS